MPDNPIIPFIEGDGTGRDIWKASVRVFDAAVKKAYAGKRRVVWYEVFAGEKAKAKFKNWLPDDTVNAIREFRVAIKGPLTTPVGGGMRSLNVALRQISRSLLLRSSGEILQGHAVAGETSRAHGHRHLPRKYRRRLRRHRVGRGHAGSARLIEFLNKDMLKGGKKQIRLDSGVGIKPISVTGTKRLVRMAIQFALDSGRKTVTLMHKGNIQKFTEGAFREWGYELATEEFRDQIVTERESWILDNKDKNPNLTIEENANLIEPGLEFAAEEFRQSMYQEVRERAQCDLRHPRQRCMEEEADDQRPHRRFDLPTGRDSRRRIFRAGDAQLERRLHFRCLRRAGWRVGHRAGRQHRRRLRDFRSHARHRSQVCR